MNTITISIPDDMTNKFNDIEVNGFSNLNEKLKKRVIELLKVL